MQEILERREKGENLEYFMRGRDGDGKVNKWVKAKSVALSTWEGE